MFNSLGERDLAARLPEREAQPSEAEQHHRPSRRFGNRRGDAGDPRLVERAKARRGREGD